MIPADRKIILFDGICNLCHASVQFVLRHDGKNKFTFASLQSEAARRLLTGFLLPAADLQTFVLIEGEKVFTRSTAALRVLKGLGSGWFIFYALIILPKFIRDPVYDLVARNRYRWFGKKNECWLPTAEFKDRFLEA